MKYKDDYIYTTKDVSEMTGLSVSRITQARKAYGLGKKIDGRTYLFCEADIDKIRARIGEIGKPRAEGAKR